MIWGILAFAVIALIWFVAGLSSGNARQKIAEEEAEHLSGVVNVRKNAEDAKHNDPDRVKRMRDNYNSK